MFALRDETDSTFAGASLQWNETAITIAGEERPFSGQFQTAKVLAVSMGRAAWRAKVLAVSKLVRHRILCAKKFARISRGARNSSPCKPKSGEKRCLLVRWASFSRKNRCKLSS
nr:hypothetical protein [Schaalia odontolytica]